MGIDRTLVSAVCRFFGATRIEGTLTLLCRSQPAADRLSRAGQVQTNLDSRRWEHPFDFYYVADFESILKPDNDDDGPIFLNTHETAGFCSHSMTPYENYRTPSHFWDRTPSKIPFCGMLGLHCKAKIKSLSPRLRRGLPVSHNLSNTCLSSRKKLEIMPLPRPMKPLEKAERDTHEKAKRVELANRHLPKRTRNAITTTTSVETIFCGMSGLQSKAETEIL